jgi:hypothetical protein
MYTYIDAMVQRQFSTFLVFLKLKVVMQLAMYTVSDSVLIHTIHEETICQLKQIHRLEMNRSMTSKITMGAGWEWD